MAGIPLHSCSGLRFSHVLFAFWCAFVGSASAVIVIQTPSFVSGSTGQNISFKCSVNEAGYRIFWYQQLPGKTELEVLGSLFSSDRELQEKHKDWQNRLEGKWETSKNWEMRLDLLRLEVHDTGFYLCAATGGLQYSEEQAYFASTGTQLLVTDPKCENHPPPSVVLLSPLCHKKRITLVCLAQGFHYEWPLDVIWKRDGQNIDRLSSATEQVQEKGECNFATASRLSVLAEEWQKGHNYSCHVSQMEQVVDDSVKGSPDHNTESTSGISEVQLSLYAGQFIFLLLGAKSLAYSAILGIYKIYRKKRL